MNKYADSLLRYFVVLSYLLVGGHHALLFGAGIQDSGPRRNSTSFEECKPGVFESIETDLGTWVVQQGVGSIDDQHAKTGKQCLHLAGGEVTVVTLRLNDNVEAGGKLSFAAERWTKRAPFKFRLSQKVDGQWQEIFSGDQSIAVGRSFLSQVGIPLGDTKTRDFQLVVSSPEGTGILIDDVKFAPAVAQEVVAVEVVPLTLPALVGAETSAFVKLKITTEGTLNPISLTTVQAQFSEASSVANIKSVGIYFGTEPNFRWNVPFGKVTSLDREGVQEFDGSQKLSEGENFIWLAGQIKDDANLDESVIARVRSVSFSNDKTIAIQNKPSVQRLGVAVRSKGQDGVHTYRIPGLATTNKGTLIGVYDVRYDGGGDLPGNIDVGMSRSTDGGQSWQPMKVIMDMGDDPKWRGDGIGDPSILVDRTTGTIWVSATWSHGNRSWVGSGPGLLPAETGQWMMVKSEDDGETWSQPINITKQVKRPEWSFILQGPGKGITMSDGTLVFPAQYQDPPNATNQKANRLPHSTLIFSQDHGATWRCATGAWDDTTESQIVELSDGRLMINCRNNRAPRRVVMTSDDRGTTWQEHSTHIKDLIEPGSCMASLINVSRELSSRDLKSPMDRLLLFSNPDSLRERSHITIKASKDLGESWPAKYHLLLDEQRGAGYSCMSMIDEATVGILYEGSQAHLTFQRVKLADILKPPSNQKTKNPALVSRPSRPVSPDKIQFARPFTDHMVLQADQPIRIWGTAKPNSDVQVEFGKANGLKTVQSDVRGNWIAELASQAISKKSRTITASSNGKSARIHDVLVGEVWICAGQSNMEWELQKDKNGAKAVAASDDPLLRLHNCPGGARGSHSVYDRAQSQRLDPEHFSSGEWKVASPESAANFSAVGYYFAKRLRNQLDVPVGMINVSVGGTPIEAWVSETRLKSDPRMAKLFDGNWLENPLLDRWCRSRASLNLKRGINGDFAIPSDKYGPNHSFKPGFMFQAGIAPFTPLSIRGALWYQGESNADDLGRTEIYDACFPMLVDEWRSMFENDQMPIVFVQLPSLERDQWPVFREYQRRSLAKLKNVGMAITIDLGHPTDVHPRNKQPVGNRLAQWALVNTYGRQGLATGPVFRSAKPVNGKLEVSFDYVGSGLKTTGGNPPLHFELAGKDGVYHPAVAKITGTQVRLSSENVPRPQHARYAWVPFPQPIPNLVNEAGLPMSPFSTEPSMSR